MTRTRLSAAAATAAAAVVVDSVRTTFGVRKVRLDVDHGLYLNDRHIKAKGMCNHQDFAGVGVAVPDAISRYRVSRLKGLGANGEKRAP